LDIFRSKVMFDLTIGGFAASALAIAAKKVIEAGVGEVIKDAYIALKNKVAIWAGNDVEALVKEPDSTGRQLTVAEKIEELSPEDKSEIKVLALALNEALRKAASDFPIGIDVEKIEAASIALKAMDVRGGTGVKINTAKTSGPFAASVRNVGEEKR
jgi:hypothetical protein